MRDIVIDETLADMDRDGDGYVTLEEYITDLWPQYERDQTGGKEPDWVKSERQQFGTYRDKNKVCRLPLHSYDGGFALASPEGVDRSMSAQ